MPQPPARSLHSGYATADDGTRLFWSAVGSGPPLYCCNGVGVSTFFWKYLERHFSDRYTVVLWDYRGHGRSARKLDGPRRVLTVERHADDLAAVAQAVEEAGLCTGPAVVVGHSMGCQVALEFRRRHPERVRGLVLALGTAGRALDTFFDWPHSPKLFRATQVLVHAVGPKVNHTLRPLLESPLAFVVAMKAQLVDPYYTSREDLVPYMAHLASLDFELFIDAVCSLNGHDAWDVLPELGVPLLVIAAENDKFTPMWCSRKMVDETPDAELLVLADASHAALIEQPETINHRLERFFAEHLAG
ncbi:MAG: alpha/beta hydrolase [Alphaproteobacteria bacterium]|nr:alpha/beta hydrolase [Alphaproteobacteria bacterium]